jgi:hypothetical protein
MAEKEEYGNAWFKEEFNFPACPIQISNYPLFAALCLIPTF